MFRGLLRLPQVRGGVHPHGHKDRSAALHILKPELPEKLYLPLLQHAGLEAIPVVKVGDKVLKGQLIAVAPTELSAPVHASSSGTVSDIAEITAAHPSGLKSTAIVIDTDGEDRWVDLAVTTNPYEEAPLDLANRVAEAGIVGMGGRFFPLP